ncbi:MAG: glucose 1-dehydrogenase [Spirochaetales bacterium]|nr:glucose 1-dehydrogenase [Spirochaetales bacterium]
MKGIMERFSLEGRTALVTGGAQGIGKAYCEALVQAGAKVAVVDINLALAEETAHALIAGGGEAIAIRTDVTIRDDVQKMVRTVVEKWGSLTIGVNNAGVGLWRDALTMDFKDWRKALSLNLDAIFLCAQAEGVQMKEQGYGKIINTASMSAHISNTPQNQCAYNASKAGVLHLTRSLAAEWAPLNICVNSISPGYTKTALVADLLDSPEGKSMLPKWLERIPMGRMALVEDLQGAVVYLAGEVSDYVSGSDILIDGGYCSW